MSISKLNSNEQTEEEIVAYMVDAITSEITDVFKFGDSYKKLTKENKKKILEFMTQENECENFNEGVSFVKLYDDILEELNKYLSNAEFNFAIRLAKHISYKDCILRTNGNPNGKILTAKDIAALLNMDDSVVRRLISALVKKGVLGKHITGCKEDPSKQIKAILCNPFIYSRGCKINNTAISLFMDSHWGLHKDEEKEGKTSKIGT